MTIKWCEYVGNINLTSAQRRDKGRYVAHLQVTYTVQLHRLVAWNHALKVVEVEFSLQSFKALKALFHGKQGYTEL